MTTQKVKMSLVDVDGNAFALMGAFKREAKRQGWNSADIDAVLYEARSSDYDHLVHTLMSHTE